MPPDMNLRDAAENALLTLVARGAILLVAGVGLPTAGWLWLRVVATQDDIITKIEKINQQLVDGRLNDQRLNSELKALSVSVAQTNAIILEEIKDHETRLRALERGQGKQ
jgi:hypothetical protein